MAQHLQHAHTHVCSVDARQQVRVKNRREKNGKQHFTALIFSFFLFRMFSFDRCIMKQLGECQRNVIDAAKLKWLELLYNVACVYVHRTLAQTVINFPPDAQI